MNTQTITIEGKDYEVLFGVMSDLVLAKRWKFKKTSQVASKLAKGFDLKPGIEPDIDQMIIISELVLSGIIAKQPKAKIDVNQVYKAIYESPETMTSLIQLYMESQPQISGTEKNVNPDQRK